ncbi:hypothetical protein HDU96_000328 [Phlyctochytrium bullatum]|nr:hypothetical protein HDU96_000328 [Phlyctochytrium bullatum]
MALTTLKRKGSKGKGKGKGGKKMSAKKAKAEEAEEAIYRHPMDAEIGQGDSIRE